MPSHAVIKLWSGEVDATGELSGSGSFTAANFEPTAQMPVDELFGHIGAWLSPISRSFRISDAWPLGSALHLPKKVWPLSRRGPHLA